MIKAIKRNAAKKQIPISGDSSTTKLGKLPGRPTLDGATMRARIIV